MLWVPTKRLAGFDARLGVRSCVFALIACLAAACGGRVELVPNDGAGGSGGASSTSTGAPQVVAPDPPCPSEPPEPTSACSQEGLACTWHTGACAVTFTCIAFTPDPNDSTACGPPLAWAEAQSGCSGGCAEGFGPCVPCDEAKEGDACNAIGFGCMGTFLGNCSGVRRCGPDHVWHEHIQDFCCI